MFSTMIDFADVLLSALLVGAMFGIWLVFNPAGLAAGVCITLQQQVSEQLKGHFGDKVFDAVIPRNVRLAEAPSYGQPGVVFDLGLWRCSFGKTPDLPKFWPNFAELDTQQHAPPLLGRRPRRPGNGTGRPRRAGP